MGITIDKWGPSAWNTLHSFAHRSPESLTESQMKEWRDFLYLFGKRLPCPKCRIHFQKFLDTSLSLENLTTRENLVRFLHEAHNDVNRRLGKKTWSYEAHRMLYSRSHSHTQGHVTFELMTATVVLAVLVAIHVRRRVKK